MCKDDIGHQFIDCVAISCSCSNNAATKDPMILFHNSQSKTCEKKHLSFLQKSSWMSGYLHRQTYCSITVVLFCVNILKCQLVAGWWSDCTSLKKDGCCPRRLYLMKQSGIVITLWQWCSGAERHFHCAAPRYQASQGDDKRVKELSGSTTEWRWGARSCGWCVSHGGSCTGPCSGSWFCPPAAGPAPSAAPSPAQQPE